MTPLCAVLEKKFATFNFNIWSHSGPCTVVVIEVSLWSTLTLTILSLTSLEVDNFFHQVLFENNERVNKYDVEVGSCCKKITSSKLSSLRLVQTSCKSAATSHWSQSIVGKIEKSTYLQRPSPLRQLLQQSATSVNEALMREAS